MAQSNPAEAVKNLFPTPELKSKIGFTLLALVIYRLGAHITAPGINVSALIDYFQNQRSGGLAGLYDLFTGGGLSRATVFALGIMPVHLVEHRLPDHGGGRSVVREDAERGRGAEQDHAVHALPHGGASPCCRRRGTRCSRSRCPAR